MPACCNFISADFCLHSQLEKSISYVCTFTLFESNLGKTQDKEPGEFGSLITKSKPLLCPAIKNKKKNQTREP